MFVEFLVRFLLRRNDKLRQNLKPETSNLKQSKESKQKNQVWQYHYHS